MRSPVTAGGLVRDAARLGLRTLLAVLVLVLVLAAGGARDATAGAPLPPGEKATSAHFLFLNTGFHDGACTWNVGVVFGSVAGAEYYEISYWDGYYGSATTTTYNPKQPPDYGLPKAVLPQFYVSATGGSGSPPCHSMDFSGEMARFSKGATAVAIVPVSTTTTATTTTTPTTTTTTPKPPTPLGIDWTMPAHLTPDTPTEQEWNVTDGLPPLSDIYPKAWDVELLLTYSGVPACPSGMTYVWTVSGDGKSQVLPGRGCKVHTTVPSLGDYSVTTKEFKGGKETGTVVTNPAVKVQDFLIVGLGDSNGAGEGNAPFYYPRCNRSVASYQFQAALYVEEHDRHSSVTFIHASCSGARIDHLTSEPYAGTRGGITPLDPQIAQVRDLIARGKPARKIDAVIMSAGVNDLAFGPILEFCVTLAHGTSPFAGCEKAPAIPKLDSTNRVIGFSAASSASTPTLGSRLATPQKELPARYGPLAADLTRPLAYDNGGLGVSPRDVYITQYPNFTNGGNGQPCGPYGLARFSTSTWAWLGANANKLNETVKSAAERHGWTLAPVNTAAFAHRGYCTSDSLFVGIKDAATSACPSYCDTGGPFHPNAEAHQIQAAEVEPLLCQRLGLGPACKDG
jgi:hypothetical protein